MKISKERSIFGIYKESFRVVSNTNILSILLLSTAILTLLSSLLYTSKYASSIILTSTALFTPFLLLYVAKQDFLVRLSRKDWIRAYATGIIAAIIMGAILVIGEILSIFNYYFLLFFGVAAVIIDFLFFTYFPQNAIHKRFFLTNFKLNYYVFKRKPLKTFLVTLLVSISFFTIMLLVQLALILLLLNYPVLSIWITSLIMWFLVFYAAASLVHAYSLIFVEKS